MILTGCNKEQPEIHAGNAQELLSLSDLKVGVRYKISQIKPEEFALLEVPNPYARSTSYRIRAWQFFTENDSGTCTLTINGNNIDLTSFTPHEGDALIFHHSPPAVPSLINTWWTFTFSTAATVWYSTGYLKTYEISGGGLILKHSDTVNMSHDQPGPKSIFNEII